MDLTELLWLNLRSMGLAANFTGATNQWLGRVTLFFAVQEDAESNFVLITELSLKKKIPIQQEHVQLVLRTV